VDTTTGAQLASRVTAAVDSASRRQGLLGRLGLEDEALIIAPCSAVHTFFMRFPIDVLFVDRQGRVTRVVHTVRPWRITGSLRGFATIELSAGTALRASTGTGHQLTLVN
jgi:uncharacterized membrane protein (UPF0127 family)